MGKKQVLPSYKCIKYILIGIVILVNIKNIFTSFDLDAEYSIAMSWRMVQGDRMFTQMWEPHQTSAFLNAFFIYLYTAVTGTTTGVALFLNGMGVLCKGVVTLFLYRTLKDKVKEPILLAMCLFFMCGNIKNLLLAEFSNMQLWFSVLLYCCLVRYLHGDSHKKGYLLWTGVFLCLEILSYPSCIVLFPILIGLLIKYSAQKGKDIMLLTLECGAIGIAYVSYFFVKIGYQEFFDCLVEIATGDRFHGQSGLNDRLPMEDILWFVQSNLIYLGIALLAALVMYFCGGKTKHSGKWWFVYSIIGLYILQSIASALLLKGEQFYLLIYPLVILVSLPCNKYCNAQERQIYFPGMFVSIGSFLATVLLTNGTLLSSLSYLVLAIVVAFIPLGNYLQQRECVTQKKAGYALMIVFCLAYLFRCGYLINPMTEYHANVFQVRGIVKSGPAAGIVSTYMGPYEMNETMVEWKQYIQPGDRVLILGSWEVSNLGYLYEDVEVCVDSVISTPTYSQKLARYWERNPEKIPNVIVARCWYGDLQVDTESWIMQWVMEEFQPDTTVDGKFWRYYRNNK